MNVSFPSLRDMLAPYKRHRDEVDGRIRDGIERHRKADAALRLTDETGAPVAGAKVTLVQRSHDFGLGCNLFLLGELETEEKNETYRRVFAETFNMATLPFYWNTLEPTPGSLRFAADSPRIYRRPPPDLCVGFCREHGIKPKLHCLNYDAWPTPDWVPRDGVAAVKRALETRFTQIAERYAASIPCVEVTNETLNPPVPKCTPFFLEPDFIHWSFETARKYFPTNELVINEPTSKVLWNIFGEMPDHMRQRFLGNRSQYYLLLEHELAQRTPIDAVGIQYHIFVPRERAVSTAATLCDPLFLYRVMDLYGSFGVPLQITETTLPAHGVSAEDEEVQAELLRMTYSVFFSHPTMEAVIYWNLVDGYAAGGSPGDMTAGENRYRGGLLRFDMGEKPAFRELRRLFREEWRTRCVLETNADGRCSFRGFRGDYDAVVEKNGRLVKRTFRLARGGAAATWTI